MKSLSFETWNHEVNKTFTHAFVLLWNVNWFINEIIIICNIKSWGECLPMHKCKHSIIMRLKNSLWYTKSPSSKRCVWLFMQTKCNEQLVLSVCVDQAKKGLIFHLQRYLYIETRMYEMNNMKLFEIRIIIKKVKK